MAALPSSLRQKISFTFSKLGAARYFSHHDIMRHFERGLRRAGLEVNHTRGFNPHPRMVFPHPLPLGVASECEEIEVEFAVRYSHQELFERLQPELLPCITLTDLKELKAVKKGRVVSSCTYRIDNFPDPALLAAANRSLLEAEEIFVQRGHAQKRREVEIRRFIEGSEACGSSITVRLSHLLDGAGRVDEIGQYLAGKLAIDWHNLDFTKIAMDFNRK